MEFVKVAGWDEGIAGLAQRLRTELSLQKQVLWFVTGGSNIAAAVKIMSQISDELSSHLTITLTDERYGPVGHADSNWQQLIEAGFDFKQARQVPVLSGDLSLEETRAAYEVSLKQLLDESEVIIGQFGMGPDGHICGILPDSAAVTAQGLVAAYETPTFKRITATFGAVKRCDAGYLLTFGADRKPALEKLQIEISLNEQPAQILKQLPEAYVYNDQVGGES